MWIKICGIRDVATAVELSGLAIDAIGLNFYEHSPRCVSPEAARGVVRRLPAGLTAVGVFVNHTGQQISEIARQCGISTVQLHGDEPPELLSKLPANLRVLKAFRVGEEGLDDVAAYLERCRHLGATPWACLVDARVEGHYGGSGQTAPWSTLAAEWRYDQWPALILAGGLNPRNVAHAIRLVRPFGVDVAGGVERAVGCKDPALVREFVENART